MMKIALELQGQVLAPVLDYRGNVRKLVNPTAQITQSNNYTGFGEELTSVTAPINPWRYSAKRFDLDLGLYYFGKRFYSPVLGRWLTTDPAEFVDGTNLYSYLFNDPLNYFDPDGRFAFALFGLTWGGAGAAASIPILSNPLGWAIGSILITGLAIHWTTNKLIESDKISPTTGAAINTALSGLAGSMIQLFPSFDYSPTTGISTGYNSFPIVSQKKNNERCSSDEPGSPPYRGDKLGSAGSKCPDKGFEWRGKGSPGNKGSWYNEGTGERIYPDLEHPEGVDPHWDYHSPTFPNGSRLFLDGTWEPK